MSKYISDLTEFRAYEAPYTDTIYVKDGNKTVCIIHIDKEWNMTGEVIDPFNIPISPIKPIYGQLNQLQCEQIIMRHMAPMCREKQLKDKYKFDKVDYAQIMYRTRLITLIDTYWVAWSESDRAEDYHPRYNEKLMEERFEDQIVIDKEEEDNEEPVPRIVTVGYLSDVDTDLPYFEFDD